VFWVEVAVKRSAAFSGGFVSAAVAVLLGCSIDGRSPGVENRSLRADAGGPDGPGGGAFTVTPAFVDLGAITQGFPARARLRVTNTGTAKAPAPAIRWAAGSHPDFTLIQNQCTRELAPGEPCDLRVQVLPSLVGELQGTLEVAGDTGVVPVTASGLLPGPIVIQAAAGSFTDFGGVRVGASSEATFSVVNPGSEASGALSLAFNRPEFTQVPAADGECVPGVTQLLGGESCTLRVAFAPTERGSQEATLSVSSLLVGSRSITLRGQGLVPAALSVSAPLLDFGGVVPGDTASLDVEVENGGDDALTLASATLSPADGGVFRIADGNCGEGVVLASGQTCRIQLDYRPVTEGVGSAGELVLTSLAGELSQRIMLQGLALTRGNLVVEAVAAGEENFGDVLIGQRIARVFRIANPTQQESGEVTLTARNGFELQPPGEVGACEPGVTKLANGQSCTVGVAFAPTARGATTGALTVDSPLAGAKSLALSGRGITEAILQPVTGTDEALVDFGRVTTGSRANRTISVRNDGDQPLAPPTLAVNASPPEQAAAFTFESGCMVPLQAGEQCDVVLVFEPTQVVAYAANLDLVAASGARSNVLLLGEALEPGRLVVAAAEGGSTDFGDVPIGGNAVRSFTVTNPGGGVSGALTVLTDDSQFVAQAGACADAGADGLADGESCTFDVAFTPTTNVATEVRLSVQATGSGETGIALTGRGRSPAALAATTTERDLGRANIGEPSGPTNEFTWTVNNSGDLPSGVLTVTNDNADDFDITVDTCQTAPVPGGGSCALTVVFTPNAAGDRTARIAVVDAVATQTVPLQVTGFGVQLAAPGDACLVSSDCMAGVCTAGVCCNVECGLTCQTCATGECLPQTGQEPCGNGGGVCFGVEQCALPAGGGCVDSTQCGGTLLCKECRTGGSQCTAAEACCGGCNAGYQCNAGECGCPFQADGRQQLDCGNGLCAIDRADACCPGTPQAGCNCDPADNRCKQCLVAAHCTGGPAGSVATCSAQRSCNFSCPLGTKLCDTTNECIPNAECCGGCALGQTCNNGTCAINDGGTCGGATPCLSGNCSQGRCCDGDCNNGCFANASCGCGLGETFDRGDCRGTDGTTCTVDDDCVNGCTGWFFDNDGDEHAAESTFPTMSTCGPNPPGPGFFTFGDDCCDANPDVHPGQNETFTLTITGCPPGVKPHDYDCDGTMRYRDNLGASDFGSCAISDTADPTTPCGDRTGILAGPNSPFGIMPADLFSNGDAALCGNSSIQWAICTGFPDAAGDCDGPATIALSPPCN
jgi:hypothetical protein